MLNVTQGGQPGLGKDMEDEGQAGTGQKEKTFPQVLKEASYTALLQTQQEEQ